MDRQLLALYGLKWSPFGSMVPREGLVCTPAVELFIRRVEALARDGGFAMITGDVGCGKTVVDRLVFESLGQNADLWVRELSRPQAHVCDFYREIGELFGVTLNPHNRWAGSKVLRERWTKHVESVRMRPVLLIDEAQDMAPIVLNELRLLASSHFDTCRLLTVVLCGDKRLTQKLDTPELLPVLSRVRPRLVLEPVPTLDLATHLKSMLATAGNPQLMTAELIATLAEHAAGNWRTLMNMGNELLEAAAQRDLAQLDEKLFLEVFAIPPGARSPRQPPGGGGKR